MKTWKLGVVAAGIGFIASALGFGFAMLPLDSPTSNQGQTNEASFPYGQSGVNSRGDTYGPLVSYDDPPDLFEAAATNGNIGYVRWTEFWEEMKPSDSLAEALAYVPVDRFIPVYAEDGTTIIGKYLIQGGSSN
jgi:hypothetical protein